MRDLIVWFITLLVIWMFPARWGADYFFPEVMAQFGSQVPWVMAWGALMFFITMLITALLSKD